MKYQFKKVSKNVEESRELICLYFEKDDDREYRINTCTTLNQSC